MIYSISDLHLSLSSSKPMDIFGDNWKNHISKITDDWNSKVKEDDIVLIPGDISWALKLEDAIADLEYIDSLSGKKIIIKGNHDYWWGSYKKINELKFSTLFFIQNNSITINDVSFCGTRGWMIPEDGNLNEDDEKIFNRELLRLENSLKTAESKDIVVLLHYPPFSKDGKRSKFVDRLEFYGVSYCVYGHIHRVFSDRNFIDGNINGIDYKLVACDYLDFKLCEIR